ncbi:MAG: AlbA family DNA-binding domain-containing protein [Planctomycetota bacterium]|jgi:hypothetical protein
MKLMSPLKAPARNTQQRIFKYIVFVVLPLMAFLTIYLFSRIDSKKNSIAEKSIRTQSSNANKRIRLFFDPISRDISYLQALVNEEKLKPQESGDILEFLDLFSNTYLQHVRHVIFRGSDSTSVYKLDGNVHMITDDIITKDQVDLFDKAVRNNDLSKIEWGKGMCASSIMAAMVTEMSGENTPYLVATDTDLTECFDGLKNYMSDRLFLFFGDSEEARMPRQFTGGDNLDIKPTEDSVIINAYAQWKKNAAESREITFRMIFEGEPWWVSIRKLDIKNRDIYSGFILSEAEVLSDLIMGRRIFAFISLISFTIVLIATVFLWRRYQRDIELHALPPAMNKMTDNEVLRTIAAGEDDRLEFKSTLRWNLRTDKPDKAMEIACLKTMAAFLNSEGGTLLVKFLLHFNNLINQHLGLENADSFSFDIRHLETGDIMIVDCLPSPVPVYVTHDRVLCPRRPRHTPLDHPGCNGIHSQPFLGAKVVIFVQEAI